MAVLICVAVVLTVSAVCFADLALNIGGEAEQRWAWIGFAGAFGAVAVAAAWGAVRLRWNRCAPCPVAVPARRLVGLAVVFLAFVGVALLPVVMQRIREWQSEPLEDEEMIYGVLETPPGSYEQSLIRTEPEGEPDAGADDPAGAP